MLVAFESCVSLMSVQLNDLELIKMVTVANCVGVKFCPGGQLFAILLSNRVEIMSTVDFAQVACLQGHCAKVRLKNTLHVFSKYFNLLDFKVEGVAWSDDGTRLISCGADGAVYTWDVSSSNRINEVVTKQCPYLGIATLATGKTNFLTTGDASIKVFQGAQVSFFLFAPK